MSTEEYIERRLDELRALILGQVKDLSQQIDRLREEQRESRLRQERLESNHRRH